MLLVALLIRIDSKGPVIYKSKRAGANFHVFNMYKFRTMEVDADQLINQLSAHNLYAETTHESSDIGTDLCPACSELGIACQQVLVDHNKSICEKAYLSGAGKSAKFMKFRNDPRVTRLGTFLRNSSIDELPQLVNILVGDMSLVGNRPLPLYEAEKLTSNEFAQRFCGPAGLTGLWQIKKRAKGQGMMSDRERTLLDIDYTNNFSFNTDIKIIWETFFSLWQKENV
jgi:lipopolysaccharide/colanic/teichoic acid biosynthesis glycosyltransferase